ncbi:hypothetical protein F4083_10825 [Candidatus Poribacteria bacterium]|nr:hypothetical protein [Candidatus Poribacteria bacterium]MYB65439.1 hypothetical protein [Candidatus Poribacteria bacterium]MYF55029.1 hypothetical protein [Candidatus Poribacteria bacterium]MYI94793.1 hypothetical protein [Candidatus Poribacteria bacterium]
MQILILDIGCSFTKCYLFKDTLEIVDEFKVTTDISSPETLEACVREVLSKFDKHTYQAIFPLSFGEGVIYNNIIYEPTHNRESLIDNKYEQTGTPTDIKRDIGSAFQSLLTFPSYSDGPALPVSTYIASRLAGVRINTWELTHAGNSGMLNISQRQWFVELLKKHKCQPLPFSTEFISPAIIVGKTEKGVSIFAGGHDHSCISVFDPKPIIIAGTWVVISFPEIVFLPRQEEKVAGIRWAITANGGFHKQVVKKVSNPITLSDMDYIVSIYKRMRVPEKSEVYVIGGYGEKLAPELDKLDSPYHFVAPPESEVYQHRQTAKYAFRALELQT